MYRAIVWYKVGRNRQRWFELGRWTLDYAAVMLAEEVSRWEGKPNVDVVGTLTPVVSL